MNTAPLTPQDKAINHSKPIETWEVYEYADRIYAHKQDWIPFYKLATSYPVCYEFKGQTAHYIVCSNDASITRRVALEWATLHAAGRIQKTTVSTDACNMPGKRK